MTERPILFSGPMVRAILEGRKSQTRRVVKGVDECAHGYDEVRGVEKVGGALTLKLAGGATVNCPYGVPGDKLWVRETWQTAHRGAAPAPGMRVLYRADGGLPDDYVAEGWRPSIFMPRWACRLVLEVTAVRVERLQSINEADARAEGFKELPFLTDDPAVHRDAARDWYMDLWGSINAKRAPWASNPWVWVVEFKRAD